MKRGSEPCLAEHTAAITPPAHQVMSAVHQYRVPQTAVAGTDLRIGSRHRTEGQMMNPFLAGQRVVCICNRATISGVVTLEIGRVYTIKAIYPPGVELEEIAPPPPLIGYKWHKFRPVNDARLDVFRRLLKKTPSSEFVDA